LPPHITFSHPVPNKLFREICKGTNSSKQADIEGAQQGILAQAPDLGGLEFTFEECNDIEGAQQGILAQAPGLGGLEFTFEECNK
jgi:hypothetical protein